MKDKSTVNILRPEDWKVDHYARLYGKHKLTLASAARHAGVSVWEFQEFTRAHRITTQYDHRDLEHDLATVKAS